MLEGWHILHFIKQKVLDSFKNAAGHWLIKNGCAIRRKARESIWYEVALLAHIHHRAYMELKSKAA